MSFSPPNGLLITTSANISLELCPPSYQILNSGSRRRNEGIVVLSSARNLPYASRQHGLGRKRKPRQKRKPEPVSAAGLFSGSFESGEPLRPSGDDGQDTDTFGFVAPFKAAAIHIGQVARNFAVLEMRDHTFRTSVNFAHEVRFSARRGERKISIWDNSHFQYP